MNCSKNVTIPECFVKKGSCGQEPSEGLEPSEGYLRCRLDCFPPFISVRCERCFNEIIRNLQTRVHPEQIPLVLGAGTRRGMRQYSKTPKLFLESAPGMKTRSLSPARSTVARLTKRLEAYLGIPRQKKKGTPPLDMLIGTLLSQNTNDLNSHRAYRRLRTKYPTWKTVAAAPVRSIAAAIKVGGMKNQKSGRIKALLEGIDRLNGSYQLGGLQRMTDEDVIAWLTQFDGIGLKTASCVLLFSLRRDVFPIDTHIHRICNRLGLVETKTPDETFNAMKLLVPRGKAYSLHTNLIRFGRTVCVARRPRCGECPLYAACQFPDKRKFAASNTALRQRPSANFMVLDELGKREPSEGLKPSEGI